MGFFAENWLVMLSLAVAVTGGIPGILSVISYWRNRPEFRFALANVVTGVTLPVSATTAGCPTEEYIREHGRTFLLLTGTASNEGKKSLIPAYYELRVIDHPQSGWL